MQATQLNELGSQTSLAKQQFCDEQSEPSFAHIGLQLEPSQVSVLLQHCWPLLQSPPEFWQKASQVLLLPGSQTSPSQQVWPSLQSAALTAQPLTQTLLVQVKPSQQGSSKLQVSPSPMQLPVQV